MRIKFSRGSDPLRACLYVLDERKQKEPGNPIIATNMSGRDAYELAAEFRFSHLLNLNVEVTMRGFSVSLNPGELLDSKQIEAISRRLLDKLEQARCQFIVVPHHDREDRNGVIHWHVLTSAVDLDGKWIDDGWIKLRLKTIERELEQEFGLIPSPPRPESEQQSLKTGEYRMQERLGKELPKEKLWRAIRAHAGNKPSVPELALRLREDGFGVRFRNEKGRWGISYECDGIAFRGKNLGKAFSFNGLKHLGVSYESERDDGLLQELMSNPFQTSAAADEGMKPILAREEIVNPSPEAGLELAVGHSDRPLLPERDDQHWTPVQNELTEQYRFPVELLHQLYEQGWLYADKKKRSVWVERSLTDESYHGLVLEQGQFYSTDPDTSLYPESMFWVATGHPLQKVVIVDDPLEVLAGYSLDAAYNPNLKPTLYMSVDRIDQLPMDVLTETSDVRVSSRCQDPIKEFLYQKLQKISELDPEHPEGWLGVWVDQVDIDQLQSQLALAEPQKQMSRPQEQLQL
jgi:hypothetical protein